MLPLLRPGDELLVDPRAYRQRPPAIGHIVIAQHPHRLDLRLLKRVTAVLEDGRCLLEGDNTSASTDSRSFGPVDPTLILARVVCRFP